MKVAGGKELCLSKERMDVTRATCNGSVSLTLAKRLEMRSDPVSVTATMVWIDPNAALSCFGCRLTL